MRLAVNLIRRELDSYPDQASRLRIAAILDELSPLPQADKPIEHDPDRPF